MLQRAKASSFVHCRRALSLFPVRNIYSARKYNHFKDPGVLCQFTQCRRSMFIQTEGTPNEHALKFIPGVPVLTEDTTDDTAKNLPREFTSIPEAGRYSRLAKALLHLEGVSSVFFGRDFVTISKQEDTEWKHIKPLVYACLMDHFSTKEPLYYRQRPASVEAAPEYSEADAEVVAMIQELLESRIRPTIQSDGGDIQFRGYRAGIVSLKLQGACRSCSSSTVTLKNGIEKMMQHYIPEIRAVEQVLDEEEKVSEAAFERTMEKIGLY